MKSIQTLLGLGAVLLASPLAFGQVVVTVDDDATNDSAYVAGSGGNLSGASALKDALLAIAGDAGQPSYEVKIIDTDGTADTYTGNLDDVNAPNLTVHQVANGKGNDAAVTIQGADESGPGAVFVVGSTNATISGLSAAKPMNIKTAGTATPNIVTALNGNNANVTWRYLNYVTVGNESLDHKDYNINTATATNKQVFDTCVFHVGNGPQTEVDVTYNNCTFAGGGIKHVQLGGDLVCNNCTFTPGAGGLHNGGVTGKTATYNDCSFQTGGAITTDNYGPRLIGWSRSKGEIQDTVFNFNRPTFTGHCGDIIFSTEDSGATVNVNGTAANKTTFDTAKPVLVARTTNGNFNFTDCAGSFRPGAGFLDVANAKDLSGDVNVTMTRCAWANGAGDLYGGATGGAFKYTFKGTNTIWTGTTTARAFIDIEASHTGGGDIELTHCTLAGKTGNAFFFGNPGSKLYMEGCIVYATWLSSSHVASSIAYTPKTPHIPCITYANVPDDGTGKAFVGNPMNGTSGSNLAPAGTWDLIVDPKLAADGHQTASSPGAGFAANSTAVALDVDGEARPNPTGTYADIGADESAAVPVQLSTFQAE